MGVLLYILSFSPHLLAEDPINDFKDIKVAKEQYEIRLGPWVTVDQSPPAQPT